MMKHKNTTILPTANAPFAFSFAHRAFDSSPPPRETDNGGMREFIMAGENELL